MYITVFSVDVLSTGAAVSICNRNELHRDIQSIFGKAREDSMNTYRVVERNNALYIYMYSEQKVTEDMVKIPWLSLVSSREYNPNVKDGDVVLVNVFVCPTKTKTYPDGSKHKVDIIDRGERREWVARKMKAAGVDVCSYINENKRSSILVEKTKKNRYSRNAYEYVFQGRIEDNNKLFKSMLNGVGRFCSYGVGMMVIA